MYNNYQYFSGITKKNITVTSKTPLVVNVVRSTNATNSVAKVKVNSIHLNGALNGIRDVQSPE